MRWWKRPQRVRFVNPFELWRDRTDFRVRKSAIRENDIRFPVDRVRVFRTSRGDINARHGIHRLGSRDGENGKCNKISWLIINLW